MCTRSTKIILCALNILQPKNVPAYPTGLKMRPHANRMLKVDKGSVLWFYMLTKRLNMVLQTAPETGLKQTTGNGNHKCQKCTAMLDCCITPTWFGVCSYNFICMSECVYNSGIRVIQCIKVKNNIKLQEQNTDLVNTLKITIILD